MQIQGRESVHEDAWRRSGFRAEVWGVNRKVGEEDSTVCVKFSVQAMDVQEHIR